MGTSTFYLRRNNFGKSLHTMTKNELERIDQLSPFGKDNEYLGWRVPFELHNGNVYVLVFWKGRLMKLEDAPKELNKKYWDRHGGKTLREYEWTLLKKMILNHIEYYDKQFKKEIKKQKRKTKSK